MRTEEVSAAGETEKYEVSAEGGNDKQRVHSIYSNIMHSEIERERSVMMGCIDNVKQAKAK